MDTDVGTMYIHILVVISAGSRVFSGTISHALTPAVVMIAHHFLILTHTQCLKTIAPDKLVWVQSHISHCCWPYYKLYLCR